MAVVDLNDLRKPEPEAEPQVPPPVQQALMGALIGYSEWLDVNGLLKNPKRDDKRTHADLIGEFIEGKGRKPL